MLMGILLQSTHCAPMWEEQRHLEISTSRDSDIVAQVALKLPGNPSSIYASRSLRRI